MLRTNYKDDVFTGNRKYVMTDNGDGTVSFEDVTQYSQTGDNVGSSLFNAQNTLLNDMEPMTLAEYNALPVKENRYYFCTEN